MLQNLHVKNLAIIEEADVEMKSGLNILSGETGAGKSIIIGSINLALGEKVPKELLRDSEEPAFVELEFEVTNPHIIERLRELDVEPEGGMVTLSRKVTNQRSVGRINGEMVAASTMREVAALLIDIHGQHEHQSLLQKRKHLELVDDYAKTLLGERKKVLAAEYSAYHKMVEELHNSAMDEDAKKREQSLLEYEVQEIEEANLSEGEDEELEQEFRRFSNGKKIMEGVNQAYAACGGEMESASELIGRAVRELGSVSAYDPKVEALENQLAEIDNLLGDFNHEISSYISEADFDEERFFHMEKRLDLINHLKSKYGRTITEILEECAKKRNRMECLADYDTYIGNLRVSIQNQERKLEQLCTEVSEIRRQAAGKLCAAIRDALVDLNFLDVQFTMDFSRLPEYTANGFDDAEFLISVNPGEPVLPLARVASGGELSRIMLAIKTVMAESDDIETLIFDEIDSGISGRTAQMVAEKMNQLGRNHQIICITHLPQIAAMADSHFLIEKSVVGQSTVSNIRSLSDEESVQELARMLGGVEITDTVMMNAREMKDMAQRKK